MASIFEQLQLDPPMKARDWWTMLDALDEATDLAAGADEPGEFTRLCELTSDLSLDHTLSVAEVICDDLANSLTAAIVDLNERIPQTEDQGDTLTWWPAMDWWPEWLDAS